MARQLGESSKLTPSQYDNQDLSRYLSNVSLARL